MIISLPLGIFQLLFLNAADTSAFTTSKVTTTSFRAIERTAFGLHAADPDDKYASLLEAYQKKKVPASNSLSFSAPASVPDAPVPVPEPVDPTPALQAIDSATSSASDKMDDILQAIDSAAASAIDASNQASEAAASISASAATATATAIKATTAAKAAAVAATASTASDSGKAPSLAEYISRVSSGAEPGGVGGLSTNAKDNIFKLKDNVASTSSTIKETVAKASSSMEPGKAPSFVDFISGKGGDVSTQAPDTKEKLILLKNNIIGNSLDIDTTAFSDKTKGMAEASSKSLSAMTAGVAGATSPSINLDSVDMSKLVENLHLDEYGAWYVTAFTFLYALKQKEDGKVEARKEFGEELALARAKADEAANAAVIAAEGAKRAKDLVKSVPIAAISNGKSGGEKFLEDSRVRQLEVSNDMMQKDLAELKKENAAQKNLINSIVKVRAKTEVEKPVKLEIPVGKTTMQRDPKEEEKFLSILKNIDTENAKNKAAVVKEVNAAKKKAVKKKRATKKATTVAKAPAPSKAPAKKKATIVAKAPAPAKAPAKKKAVNKKRATKKAVPKKAAAPEVESEPFHMRESSAEKAIKDIEAAEESFNEAMAESSKEADLIEEMKGLFAKPKESTSKPAAAPKKKKESTQKKAAASAEPNANPWGKLKVSTLKRKTVAQLSEYLNERQITIEGLSKTELVGTIQSL